MKKRKTKKRRFDTLFDFFLHPLSPFDHLTIVRLTLIFCGLIWVTGGASAFEPPETAQNSNNSHARVFVIFATVFSDQGFALTGARARVRRTDEKKYRWEGMSDHQGEVAFRVPPGGEYELIIEARGFKPEIRKINAREENQSDLTIRMAALTAPETVPHKTDTGTGGKP